MLVITSASAQSARDPFAPPVLSPCADLSFIERWRLRGVIGSEPRWHGWMVTPTGNWQRLRAGEWIVPGEARVFTLNPRELRVQLLQPPHCTEQKISFPLAESRSKGSEK